MSISDRIRELSSKDIILQFAAFSKPMDTYSLFLNDDSELKVNFRKNKLELSFNTENSEFGKLLHALTYELAKYCESTNNISFRELENMLRDSNSIPSAEQSLLERAETSYTTIKKVIEWPLMINTILVNESIQLSVLDGKGFFEQIKSLDDLHRAYSEVSNLERGDMPRLNTWDPRTGELNLIVDSKTTLGRADTELFRLFWSLFDNVKIIKMVASESL